MLPVVASATLAPVYKFNSVYIPNLSNVRALSK